MPELMLVAWNGPAVDLDALSTIILDVTRKPGAQNLSFTLPFRYLRLDVDQA